MAKRRCFLICTFKDGELQRRADGLLRLLRDALKDGFDVVRGDELAVSGGALVMASILKELENADLCIADVSVSNDNVFYEIGFRHRTNRPLIHVHYDDHGEQPQPPPGGNREVESDLVGDVARAIEALPFNMQSMRFLKLQAGSLNEYLKSQDEVRRYVHAMEDGGVFDNQKAPATLETIRDTVARIEEYCKSAGTFGLGTPPRRSGPNLRGKVYADPRQDFLTAFASGETQDAEEALPRLVATVRDLDVKLAAAGSLAIRGSEVGAGFIEKLVDEAGDSMTVDAWKAAIGGLVTFYNVTDREEEALQKIHTHLQRVGSQFMLSNADRAWFRNQEQRLLYGAGKLEDALKGAEEVVSLAPEEPAYWFNLSLIYEKIGMIDKSVECVDKCLAYSVPEEMDADHLLHAVDSYYDAGRVADARAAVELLRKHGPDKIPLLALVASAEKRRSLGID